MELNKKKFKQLVDVSDCYKNVILTFNTGHNDAIGLLVGDQGPFN